jgi:hypothetical protein
MIWWLPWSGLLVLVAQRLSHQVVLWRVMATSLQTHLAGPSLCSIPVWREHPPLRLNLVEHAGFLVLEIFSLVFILQHNRHPCCLWCSPNLCWLDWWPQLNRHRQVTVRFQEKSRSVVHRWVLLTLLRCLLLATVSRVHIWVIFLLRIWKGHLRQPRLAWVIHRSTSSNGQWRHLAWVVGFLSIRPRSLRVLVILLLSVERNQYLELWVLLSTLICIMLYLYCAGCLQEENLLSQ